MTTPGRSPTSALLCVTAGCKRPVTEGSAYLCAECAARIASVGSCPTSEAVCECGHPRDAHSYWSERRQEYGACSRCPHNECDEYEESTSRLPASEPVCATCGDSGRVKEWRDPPWPVGAGGDRINGYEVEVPCPKCHKGATSSIDYSQRVGHEKLRADCTPPSARSDQGGERDDGLQDFIDDWQFLSDDRGYAVRWLRELSRLRARSSVSAGGDISSDDRDELVHLAYYLREQRLTKTAAVVDRVIAALSRSSLGETKTEDGE